MPIHDYFHKKLFGHPEVVADLALYFLAKEIVRAPDFTTLTPCPTEFQFKYQTRISDCVWHAQTTHDSGTDLLFVLEFQTKPDAEMSLRIMVYGRHACLTAVKTRPRTGGVLPEVLPVVLYGGKSPWTAATSLSERQIKDNRAKSLRIQQSTSEYILLDEWRLAQAGLPLGSLVSVLISTFCSNFKETLKHFVAIGPTLESLNNPALEETFRELYDSVLLKISNNSVKSDPGINFSEYLKMNIQEEMSELVPG